MRWIATLTLFLSLAVGALAQSPDDNYLSIYNKILQADTLQQGGQSGPAVVQYLAARTELQKFHDNFPDYNKDAVVFRLQYLDDKVKELAAFIPATNNVPVTPKPTMGLTPQQQIAVLQEQIGALSNANSDLQLKLKEALSVQPAAVAPGELAKAQEKITTLEKERDLLSVSLEQEKKATKSTGSKSDTAKLKSDLADLQKRSSEADKLAASEIASLRKKLDDANADLKAAKSEKPDTDKVKKLTAEQDQLKKDLAAAKKEAAAQEDSLRSADAAKLSSVEKERDELKKSLANADKAAAGREANARSMDAAQLTAVEKERDELKKSLANASKDLADREASVRNADAAQLKKVEKERDDLQKQLAAVMPAPPSKRTGTGDNAEMERLRSVVNVLEAKAVPYTAEELAILNSSTPASVVAPPAVATVTDSKVRSAKDLSPDAVKLVREALDDVNAKNYDAAEKIFQSALKLDPNNIYLIASLGSAQFAANKLDDCEKTVQRAVALDPNDAGTLYLLGILRYRQNKLDESLDALSRSANMNMTNTATEYYLGCVLAEKGMRPQAETAFRKVLQLDPRDRDAHFNLAMVLAAETPPSRALAQWNYQKALDLGHEKSPALEKLISEGK